MKRSVLIAAGLAVAIVVWMASGHFSSGTDSTASQEASATSAPASAGSAPSLATEVTLKHYQAQDLAITRTWQGEVVPVQTFNLRLQTSGTVKMRHHEKGDTVRAGDPILTLDPADRLARKAQAEAELALRRQTLEANRALFKRGLLSDTQLKTDEALLAAAEAALEQINRELDYTVLRAPRDGVLTALTAEPGEAHVSGESVGTLIVTSPIRVTFGIPQQEIRQIRTGQAVEVKLADDTHLAGAITWIAPQAHDAMRTFEAEADIPVTEPVKLGQSATVTVKLGTVKAHKLSGALLNLAADGGLYVKAADSQNRVIRYPVELVQADPDGFWVSGLPEDVDLIVIGQGFVSAGDTVKPRRQAEPAT
ncbi:MAG: efflux RND transporter periplasmic adaptor subunit [Gammaproteobacteria bacterium]|nr:MAG: efflux RND transporter periplasmic adaptor subunit [Gammaproteobacteria bacterium]